MKKILMTISMIAAINSAYASGEKRIDLAPAPPQGFTSSPQPVQPSPGNKCNAVLDKCETIRQKQKELIEQQDELVKFQREQIKDLKSSKESFFSNPWLYFGVGLITGVIVTK